MKIKYAIQLSLLIISAIITFFSFLVFMKSFDMNLGIIVELVFLSIFIFFFRQSLLIYKVYNKKEKKQKTIDSIQLEFDFIDYHNATNTLMYPNIKHSIFALIILILVQTLLSVAFAALPPKINFSNDKALLTGLVNLISFSAICFYYIKKNGASLNKIILLRTFQVKYLFPLVSIFLCIAFFLVKIDLIVQHYFPVPQFFESSIYEFSGNILTKYTAYITIAIIAPITEEVFFRGIIFRSFLNHYSLRKSIIISSLLFAIIHLNPWQFYIALALGILFSIMDFRLKSIVPSIICHSLYNSFGFFVNLEIIQIEYGFLFDMILFIIISALLIVYSFWKRKNNNRTIASTG